MLDRNVDKIESLTRVSRIMAGSIIRAQEILAEWIVPDSKMTDQEALNKLLGVLDDRVLVAEIRSSKFDPKVITSQKIWDRSPNVKRTSYSLPDQVMEVEYLSGNIYQYMDVPGYLWGELLQSESIGSFLAEHVKGKYRYSQFNGE